MFRQGRIVPVRFSDRAKIEALLDACAANGYRVRDLILSLVHSDIFLGVQPTP